MLKDQLTSMAEIYLGKYKSRTIILVFLSKDRRNWGLQEGWRIEASSGLLGRC